MTKKKILFVIAISLSVGIGFAQGVRYKDDAIRTTREAEITEKTTKQPVNNTDAERHLSGNSGNFLPMQTSRAMWDIVARIYGTDGRQAAIATDGNHFYLADWQNSDILQLSMAGNYLKTFSIPGVSQIRSLAYDGTYFYASNTTNTVFVLDFANETLVGTINAGSTVRHLTYDPELDNGNGGFWFGNWSNIRAMDMQGNQIFANSTVEAVYGTAYDPYSPSGPYLWLFSQDEDTSMNVLYQWRISTRSFTGVYYDVYPDALDVSSWPLAGGAFGFEMNGKWCLAANLQVTPNQIIIYELADIADAAAPAAVSALTVTPETPGALTVEISWTNPELTYGGNPLNEITAVKLYEGNNLLIETVNNPVPGSESSYNHTVTATGLYTYKVFAENANGEGPLVRKKIWIGHDVPASPSDLLLVNNNMVAELTWTEPTTGLNGGHFTQTGLVYDIFRNPGNVSVATDHTGNIFSELIENPGKISYRIVAKNGIGTGGAANTPETSFCPTLTLPWIEDFSGTTFPPPCWEHVQSSSVGWLRGVSIYHTPPASANTMSISTDCWLITPPIDLSEKAGLTFMSYITNSQNYHLGSSSVYISTTGNSISDFTLIKTLSDTEIVEGEWIEISIPLPYKGETVYIAFEYTRSTMAHSWYIDDISVYEVVDNDLQAVNITGNPSPAANNPTSYTINVYNMGTSILTGSEYTVELYTEDGILIDFLQGVAIEPGETKLFVIDWTPTTVGNTYIYGYVNYSEDHDLSNNTTPNFDVNVRPEGVITIGNGNTFNNSVPINFNSRNSLSQVIYFADEIGIEGGLITQLRFFNDFVDDLSVGKHIKIHFANTEINANEAWLDPSHFIKVFDGNIEFPEGENEITVPFDEPFAYQGNNIVIMTQRIYEEQSYSGFNFFVHTNSTVTRSRYAFANYDFGDVPPTAGSTIMSFPNIQLFTITNGLSSVAGVVTSDGTTPVERALVEIVGTERKQVTNADGIYSFDYLLPDTYTLKASKLGYYNVEQTVTVTEEEHLTADFIIPELPKFTVTGIVTDNAIPGVGLEEVTITLIGDFNYTGNTNEDGTYVISNVAEGAYTITAQLLGYSSYSGTFNVSAENTTYNIVLDEIIVAPFNLNVTVTGNNALFTWDIIIESFFDDFESYENFIIENIGDYTLIDGDGLGTYGTGDDYPNKFYTGSYMIFNPTATSPPMSGNAFNLFAPWSGNKYAACFNTTSGSNNDWLILPKMYISNGMVFEFMAKTAEGYSPNWFERYKVGISTTGTQQSDFTFITESPYVTVPNDWTLQSYDLSDYAGLEIYIAINCVSTNNFAFLVDDIYVGFPSKVNKSRELASFSVYLNNVPNESDIKDNEYLFEELTPGTYIAGVKAVYTTGESEIVYSEPFEISTPEPTYTVTFNVFDSETDEPITDATIIFNDELLTDYVVENVPVGTHHYTVSKEGYETKNGQINVEDADITEPIALEKLHPGITATSLSSIILYPNPFKDEIFVDSEHPIMNIQILNAIGQKVKEVVLTNETQNKPETSNLKPETSNLKLQTSNLPCGVYFVTIENNKGEKLVHKMVK